MNVKKIMKSINVILINLFYKKYVVNIMNVNTIIINIKIIIVW